MYTPTLNSCDIVEMKRSTAYFCTLLIVACVWIWAKMAVQEEVYPKARLIVDYFPLLAILLFGGLCAAKLSYDLATFNNYPQEIGELEKDIKGARADLKKRGVPVDGVSAKFRVQ